MKKIKNLSKIKVFYLFLVVLIILNFLSSLPTPLFPSSSSKLILDDEGKVIHAFLNDIEHYQFELISDSIPFKLKKSILSFEDKNFYWHLGVDPGAIIRAIYLNVKEGKVLSGASTITMQLARLMKPKKRNFWNKFTETLQAIRIELLYTKEEILRMYCEHAPYGRNFIGVETASYFYFKKELQQLTWAESSLLAVLPNSPGLLNPLKNKKLLKKKRNNLLRILFNDSNMSKSEYKLSLKENLPNSIRMAPKIAAHASFLLKRNSGDANLVRSTISSTLQKKINTIVQEYRIELNNLGIENLSLLVSETKSGKVKAYIGSQDFYDMEHQGMVDGVQAKRSSGSILKPFLYTLAMEDGILLPQTLLHDVPSYYDTFTPKNANKKFAGYSSAENALIQSLNVPPVRVLYEYGVEHFYNNMKDLGVKSFFRNANEYGLPLILGGAEVTLWDMINCYATLGNLGQSKKISLFKDRSSETTVAKFQKTSSYLTLNILKRLKRPGVEYYWDHYDSSNPLAWKTGTSYGLKDAWAIGTSPKWTIGVWVGNFSGEGNSNISGAKRAGPLLFKVFNLLNREEKEPWYEEPPKSKLIELCKVTGFQAGEHCPNRISAISPKTTKPLKKCTWHKKIFFDKEKKYQVCSLCWGKDHISEVKLIYPKAMSRQMEQNGIELEKLVAHKKTCPSLLAKEMLFLYPEDNAVISIPRENDGKKMKIVVKIQHENSGTKRYWYLDNYFLEENDLTELPLFLPVGKHRITVVDAGGAEISRKLTVVGHN